MAIAGAKGVFHPFTDEDGPSITNVPFNGTTIDVWGKLPSLPSVPNVVWDAFTLFYDTAAQFFVSHGVTSDALSHDDSMSRARAKIMAALTDRNSNLSQNVKDELENKVVNAMLPGGDAEYYLRGLTNLDGLKIIDVPNLINNGHAVDAVAVPPMNGEPWTIKIDVQHARDVEAAGIHNWLAADLVHELLHVASQGVWDHVGPNAGESWDDWVARSRSDPNAPDHEWSVRMDAVGNAMHLIDDTNRAHWIPIVIDMTGQGPNLVSKNDSHVSIDVAGDGFSRPTGWIGKGQALLVADWNGNGRVDNGTEISFARFGKDPNSDLSGLASFDLNHDGRIDKNDAVYSKLRLWVDVNGDGVSQPGELKTLEEANVVSVDLHMHDFKMEQGGNIITHVVDVVTTSGATLSAYDVGFGI
jgi:hypothetical protein